MGNLARYRAADLPELMDRITKNSIGLDSYLDQFFNVTQQQTYPPYNLVQINNVESRLEIALAGFKKNEVKVLRSLENYLWKAKKRNQKMMENLSIKDWPNGPLPDNGRSQMIRRYDPSALTTDSLWLNWEK